MCIRDSFWTQFEAWLSMQMCTATGFVPADAEADQRCTIEPIFNATRTFADEVRAMWLKRASAEAYDVLSLDDVLVTSAKDKDDCLQKLSILEEEVMAFCTGHVEHGMDPSGVPERLPEEA